MRRGGLVCDRKCAILWRNGARIERLAEMVESGNMVACLFDSVFTKPFQATIRMSEWLTIEGEKIVSAVLIDDTAKMPMPGKA